MDETSRSSGYDDESEPGPQVSSLEKRSALLTVALEHNLINLLTGCIFHWSDGKGTFKNYVTRLKRGRPSLFWEGPVFPVIVSSGHSCAFYVVFVPLEYVPTIPPHSSNVIDICFILFK